MMPSSSWTSATPPTSAWFSGVRFGRMGWVQAECKKLGDNDNPEVSDLLKTNICCLKERPVLFKYCAEEIANMRHHALFRRFISALTRGGPGGLPRPFEVHAHDPLRYVGDMLGWLHQILPAASITGPFPMGSFSEITNPSCEQAKIDVPMDNPLHSSIITSDCNEGVRIDHREVGEERVQAAGKFHLIPTLGLGDITSNGSAVCNSAIDTVSFDKDPSASKETAATSKLFSGQRSWTSRGYKHTLILF
ncbi:hypothetical protein OPV22_034700 [Ensete ventricosum]|uniref:Conserved Oligomeric Golgi complex subunit 6 C-terminal domain-containing protein n=1 Tax=Ensete ventricosum TaxID=4639 RepID=A0AAV8Q5K4_ENSVE|nr:hypothetical protein OPV22_034700 [Ensete ventricosum]